MPYRICGPFFRTLMYLCSKSSLFSVFTFVVSGTSRYGLVPLLDSSQRVTPWLHTREMNLRMLVLNVSLGVNNATREGIYSAVRRNYSVI
jgi:hypothetical protein